MAEEREINWRGIIILAIIIIVIWFSWRSCNGEPPPTFCDLLAETASNLEARYPSSSSKGLRPENYQIDSLGSEIIFEDSQMVSEKLILDKILQWADDFIQKQNQRLDALGVDTTYFNAAQKEAYKRGELVNTNRKVGYLLTPVISFDSEMGGGVNPKEVSINGKAMCKLYLDFKLHTITEYPEVLRRELDQKVSNRINNSNYFRTFALRN